jgi:hypothetical protein
MSASSIGPFLDAMTTALAARVGLAGVVVYSCPVPPEALGKEAIELAPSVEVTQEAAAMSSSHITEGYDVKGSILVSIAMAPGATKPATINAAAKASRDRALAIYDEVRDYLAAAPTVSGTVLGAEVGGLTLEQGFAPEGQLGRSCRIEFTISVEAHVT